MNRRTFIASLAATATLPAFPQDAGIHPKDEFKSGMTGRTVDCQQQGRKIRKLIREDASSLLYQGGMKIFNSEKPGSKFLIAAMSKKTLQAIPKKVAIHPPLRLSHRGSLELTELITAEHNNLKLGLWILQSDNYPYGEVDLFGWSLQEEDFVASYSVSLLA